MADSAQVPRVHAKYTTDSAQVNRVHVQVHRGDSRGVLGHGRRVLELKLHKEESKYTEAIAKSTIQRIKQPSLNVSYTSHKHSSHCNDRRWEICVQNIANPLVTNTGN